MTTKTKGRSGGDRPTPKTAFDSRNHTATDPLTGWFNLASNVKPSRNRQQKKSWNRGRR